MIEPKEIGSDARPPRPLTAPGSLVLAGLVLVLALALDLYRLDRPSVWLDEAVTWEIVHGSWRHLVAQVRFGEDCGGLVYAVTVKLWTGLFGYSELALRLPGVLAGLGFVAVMLWIAGALWGRAAGLYTGLLAATHPEVLCWCRQARAYSFELFFTALSLAGLLLYCRPYRRRRWALLVGATCLLVLTHGFGVFVVVGMALFVALARFLRADPTANGAGGWWTLWPLIPALVLAALAALALRDRAERVLEVFWITGSVAGNFLRALTSLLVPWGLAGFLVAAGWWLLVRDPAARANRRVAGAVLCLTLTILGGPVAVSLLSRGSHNFILARYCLPCLAVFVLPMGYLFTRWPARWGIPLALGLCLAGFVLHRAPRYYSDRGHDSSDTRGAVALLRQERAPDDRVLVCPGYEAQPLAYYGLTEPAVVPVRDRSALRKELDALLRTPQPIRTWLALYECPEQDDLNELGLRRSPQWSFGTLRLVRLDPTLAVAESRQRREKGWEAAWGD